MLNSSVFACILTVQWWLLNVTKNRKNNTEKKLLISYILKLMKKLFYFMLGWLVLTTVQVYAQRGLPPKQKTRSVLITKYPQHLDFLPEMVKLLQVPKGWEVSVAASGLGKARMLYNAPNSGPSIHLERKNRSEVGFIFIADCLKNAV